MSCPCITGFKRYMRRRNLVLVADSDDTDRVFEVYCKECESFGEITPYEEDDDVDDEEE